MSSMRNLTVAVAAVAAALMVACGGMASAVVLPNDRQLAPTGPAVVKPVYKPDLRVSATSTSIVIRNGSLAPAGRFSVFVSKGYVGDTCGWEIPALTRSYLGLGPGGTIVISLKNAQSSNNRNVVVDYLHQVNESNELNNTAIVPGETIVC